jgi:hypothetical protein
MRSAYGTVGWLVAWDQISTTFHYGETRTVFAISHLCCPDKNFCEVTDEVPIERLTG